MKLLDFLKDKFYYDQHGQWIFLVQPSGNCQKILDIRGWGAIQHLYPMTDSGQKDAAKFQDELGEWVATALNEKIGVFIPPSEKEEPKVKCEHKRVRENISGGRFDECLDCGKTWG